MTQPHASGPAHRVFRESTLTMTVAPEAYRLDTGSERQKLDPHGRPTRRSL